MNDFESQITLEAFVFFFNHEYLSDTKRRPLQICATCNYFSAR